MDSYHGTSSAVAAYLAAGNVEATVGGGELGIGFYTGQYLHEAKAWALHHSGDRRANVVSFSTPDREIEQLDLLLLDRVEAYRRRQAIRQAGETRTFMFFVDMVWSPIVGTTRVTGDQFKWESDRAEDLLNSAVTIRVVL